jgi:hypothetical protein
MTNTKLFKIVFFIGGVLTVVASLAQLFNVIWAPYLFGIGALAIILVQLRIYKDFKGGEREQRLVRMSLFSSLLLGLAAYLMYTGSNSWVVAVLIYALSSLFISFRGK